MDDMERELMPIEDLSYDNDSSDDNSTKERRESELPLVDEISVGEFSYKS